MRPERVLLIEDNADDEYLTLRTLQAFKYNLSLIDIARDGAEAMLMLDSGIDYSLVVLDLKLPKIDGIALLRKFSVGGRYNFIVLSSTVDPREIAECLRLGAPVYNKPLSIDSLINYYYRKITGTAMTCVTV